MAVPHVNLTSPAVYFSNSQLQLSGSLNRWSFENILDIQYHHNGIIIPDICVQLWLAISNAFIRWLMLFFFFFVFKLLGCLCPDVFHWIHVCKNYSAAVIHCKSPELSCPTYENDQTYNNLSNFLFCFCFFLLVIIHCLIEVQSGLPTICLHFHVLDRSHLRIPI